MKEHLFVVNKRSSNRTGLFGLGFERAKEKSECRTTDDKDLQRPSGNIWQGHAMAPQTLIQSHRGFSDVCHHGKAPNAGNDVSAATDEPPGRLREPWVKERSNAKVVQPVDVYESGYDEHRYHRISKPKVIPHGSTFIHEKLARKENTGIAYQLQS